jgi:hypothetical protein
MRRDAYFARFRVTRAEAENSGMTATVGRGGAIGYRACAAALYLEEVVMRRVPHGGVRGAQPPPH